MKKVVKSGKKIIRREVSKEEALEMFADDPYKLDLIADLEEGIIAMKSTGIVRKVDELGRIVLPMELRKMLDLNVKDPVEIFVDDERIILQKYYPACIFCGDADDVIYYNGKRICAKCLNNLKTKF